MGYVDWYWTGVLWCVCVYFARLQVIAVCVNVCVLSVCMRVVYMGEWVGVQDSRGTTTAGKVFLKEEAN